MGKSSPSAPSPSATASAQTTLNDVSQYTPFGSLVYNQNGTVNGVPQMSATTSLSPQEQQLFNGQMQQDQGLLQPENSLLNQINANYGGSSGGSPGGFMNASGYSTPSGSGSSGKGKSSSPQNPSPAASGQSPSGFSPVTGGMSGSGLNSWMGSFQGSAGPAAQAQAQQAGVAQAGGGQIQSSLGPQDLQTAFNQQQQAAYGSQMGYLQPQEQQQTGQLKDQLAQQGITQASNPTAYANAMQLNSNQQDFANQQAFNNSYQSGLAGANQLFNQNLGAGEFANSAQQQGFNQSATNAGFENTAALQNAQLGTTADMYNAGQANQMAMGNAGLNNSALMNEMAGYGQNAGLNNSANAQQYQNLFNSQNQPINQLNALRGMNQVNTPSFTSTPSAGNNYSNNVQQQYASQLASYNNSLSGLFGLGGAGMMAYALA